MKRCAGYIPAVVLTGYYLCAYLLSVRIGVAMTMTVAWLLGLWIAAILWHKGLFWGGGCFGIISAVGMICFGAQSADRGIKEEVIIGAVLIVFYGAYSFLIWKNRDQETKSSNRDALIMIIKSLMSVGAVVVSLYIGIVYAMIIGSKGIHTVFGSIGALAIPVFLISMIWLKKRKKVLIIWLIIAVVYFVAMGINYGIVKYNESITVDTSPNINVYDYLPFKENSKIVKAESETLKLTDNLPRIDGAAALFPVYSGFVNAVYPETTKLNDGVFEYNNTSVGYHLLAEKKSDIFIGVYPSEEQKAYAEQCGTAFRYTPIGTEAFVFFVHKDNPIESLTTEEIQKIYSGEITNWNQLGGEDEAIVAFQRNPGSGSQSMLERFMEDKPIMQAPTEQVTDLMSGIIEQVADYKSKSGSIGFSFRYYVEGIIQNPDIKMLSVDGIAPTAENIKNGTYPITTPIYAVTYENNPNENVDKLLEWILSEEGQYILEETGYVGINN